MPPLKKNLAVADKIEPFYTGGSVQISSDGQFMFCGFAQHVNIMQLDTAKITHSIGQEDEELTSFCVSPDDQFLVLATQKLLLRKWKWKRNELDYSWKALHTTPVMSMVFDPTSTLLVTGGSDCLIKVWDCIQQYCTHHLRGHTGVVRFDVALMEPYERRDTLGSLKTDSALRPIMLRRMFGLCGLFLAFFQKRYRLVFVCADIATHYKGISTATHHRGMNRTNINTTFGPLKINDVCPGVDYFINHNMTNTPILQVNVSDGEYDFPEFTAHQGVVYGVFEDSTVFCKLHVEVPQDMYVRARVERLAYWCDTHQWGVYLQNDMTTWSYNVIYIGVVCNYHTIDHMFVESSENHMFVFNNNRPSVMIDIEPIVRHSFVRKNRLKYSGYVKVPFSFSQFLSICEELKIPSGCVVMVSIQQSYSPALCYWNQLIQLIYRKPNTSRPTVAHMCSDRPTPANVFLTSYLKIQLLKTNYHFYLKLYFSTLSENDKPEELPSGLFNCSVHYYSKFQQHLHCDLQPGCEDGRDETEDCPFSSPGCQGLVASRNKCFKLVVLDHFARYSILILKCKAVGGNLASMKTREEQKDSLHMFKRYNHINLVFGYTSGWYSVSFIYSKFRKWSDDTLIYRMNHFGITFIYRPSRIVKSELLSSMHIETSIQLEKIKSEKALCEKAIQSLSGPPPQTTLPTVRFAYHHRASIFTITRQVLTDCFNNQMTHILLCDSNSLCGKPTQSHLCTFMNLSDRQNKKWMPLMRSMQSYSFRCDDDTTTVHHTVVCDFIQDCPYYSDESFCQHPSCDGFMCLNGQCVSHSQQCNDYSDCLDDSDEVSCPEHDTYHPVVREEDQKQPFHIILDGTGYFTQQAMKDEEPCPDTHYRCAAEWLYCLPVYTRCNGFFDCVYGEDEQDCGQVMCPGFYQCKASRICVHGDHLCDGWGQCPQRDDELLCDMTCPEGCMCEGHSFLCSEPFPADRFLQLRYVDATGSEMLPDDFRKNVYLTYLSLSHCNLVNVSCMKLSNLLLINLANNYLRTLDVTVFLELPKLRFLQLANNPLRLLTNKVLKNIHYALRQLDISKTRLKMINSTLAIYLPLVQHLNVSYSGIETIGSIGFKTMPQLTLVDLRVNPLNDAPLSLLSGLKYLQSVFSSNYKFCCVNLLPKQPGRINCLAPHTALPSCGQLIPTESYRIFFSLVSVSAILGNLVCFTATSAFKKILQNRFRMVIAHLQFANICMGSHVSIAVIANSIFHGQYIHFEKAWTTSTICKMNGFLSLLSSVVSICIIYFITLGHGIVLCFPGNSWRFNKTSTPVACTVMWMVGMLLSLIPFLPGLSHWGLHGQSGMCRLALFDDYNSSAQFKWFTVIVVINCILSLMIVAGQIIIYIRMPKYRVALDPSKRSVYSSVHLMWNISITDAVCWISFGLITMMISQGVIGSDKIHDVMVVFMLPLNSALNPLLYIWNVTTQRRQQAQEDRVLEMLKSRLPMSGNK